jgi:hypothetical protein
MAVTPAFSKGPAGVGGLSKISFPELESPAPNFGDELALDASRFKQQSFGPPRIFEAQQDLSAPDLTDKETQTDASLMLQSIPNMRDANIDAH